MKKLSRLIQSRQKLMPLLSRTAFFLIGFILFVQNLEAQQDEPESCYFGISSEITCNGIIIKFTGTSEDLDQKWDFGDSTGNVGLKTVEHIYGDVNTDINPITAKHWTADCGFWFERAVEFPGVIIGNGCGSTRLVSNLITNEIFPANSLIGKNLYVFGDLEIDIPYTFDDCDIFMSNGGKIIVKSGGSLTLSNTTTIDGNRVSGACDELWNGIEVLTGGALIANDATIKNAYFGINIRNENNVNPIPKISLSNTTLSGNFIGVYAASGSFIFSKFVNNTFEGSGGSDIFNVSSCVAPNTIIGIPFSKKTYCGIYFDGSLGSRLLLVGQSTNNVFKNFQAGIVCLNGTAYVQGCRFENIIYQQNSPANYQGTALTFIDNIGGKRLYFTGLGKNGTPTINNCERGVYVSTSKPLTGASITGCRMLEVQNGVNMDETGIGNLSSASVIGSYIGCTKYVHNIKVTTTGIEIRDPNISSSYFSILSNDIDVDQPEGYSPIDLVIPEIVPTGINVVSMQNQASNSPGSMLIQDNTIHLINGVWGINVENVANADIIGNQIFHDNIHAFNPFDFQQTGINVMGGINNSLRCNVISKSTDLAGITLGIYCVASPHIIMSQNTLNNLHNSIIIQEDNGTDCIIQNNNFNLDLGLLAPTALYYNGAITGPQTLNGNEWIGDYEYGAKFVPSTNGFSYCTSIYTVSSDANVNNNINPVFPLATSDCDGLIGYDTWFNTSGAENHYTCINPTGGGDGTIVKNDADIILAGGETQNIDPGYQWTSELGLYRKFSENPGLATGDIVMQSFMQIQFDQPIAKMFNVRNSLNAIDDTSSTVQQSIKSIINQLGIVEQGLFDRINNIDVEPSSLSNINVLNMEANSLEEALNSNIIESINNRSLLSSFVNESNNEIPCNSTPCQLEQQLNSLYLETQIISPRQLTIEELQFIKETGLKCHNEAGAAIYLAKSWYYLQTGELLNSHCSQIISESETIERTSQVMSLDRLKISPNPTKGGVEIIIPESIKGGTVTIKDIWGKVIFQQSICEDIMNEYITYIDTEKWQQGTYFILGTNKSGNRIDIQKMIVIR